MQELSRRTLLASSGAAAALGTLGVSAQAAALPWTWSSSGALRGSGPAADPRFVHDPEADALVASLFERGLVEQTNRALAYWKTNQQTLPSGLPADVRAFIEEARRLPSWYDPAKAREAAKFNTKRGLYLGVLYGFVSGMLATVIPAEARAVYYSKGGWDLKDRISKTAKLGYDICSLDAYEPGGELVVTCVKTRLAHAGVRYLLPKSPHWQASAPEEIPISQHDLLVTWHSLPTSVMRTLKKWRVSIPVAEQEGFLHTWQLSGYLLGMKEEYLPQSWRSAETQAQQVLDPILAPTPEGLKIADMLLDLGQGIDGTILTRGVLEALTRYSLGDEIARWLKIRRQPVWDSLLNVAWRPFVAVREGILPLPFMPAAAWAFDELLRQFVLLYMSEVKPINIEIPVMNNPSYS